jgi:hypothetical protein
MLHLMVRFLKQKCVVEAKASWTLAKDCGGISHSYKEVIGLIKRNI